MDAADLRATAPPPEWGVAVDDDALSALAARWAPDRFVLPDFDYPGTPAERDERWWFDYVTLSVSILACLWPPDGDEMWRTKLDGQWLDDAPGIFAVFTRRLGRDGLSVDEFCDLSNDDGLELFDGTGMLQLIPERIETLRNVARTIVDSWDGSAVNLVEEAGRNGSKIASLLSETMPGYRDRPLSSRGELRFDKLAHLAASIMAAGLGWSKAGFSGFDEFPVYPDYMLPRVLRHFGVMRYSAELTALVDAQQLLPADSEAEHAIRWATVHSGEALKTALAARGNAVSAPALDYRLWSEAVLGPDADRFGEHHRTVTLRY